MPDLGGVAAAPSIVCQIYGVENGQFFVEVFPVDVARGETSQRSSSSFRQIQKRTGISNPP